MHAYDRLESGKGPGSPSFRKRAWAWRRWMIGGAAVVLLVWIGLSGRDRVGWSSSTDPTLEYEYHPAPPSAYEPHQPDYDTTPRPPTSPSSPRPTSHATDPDLSKTVHCTTPYTPNARLVQYALMIDAGSTGSRIHVYKFHNCGPAPTYEYETFAQRKPGLSAYSGKPAEAAASLDELMDVALSHVPKELHACTPVAVKATAGLRLLGAAESAAILAAVRQHLSDAYPFPVPDAEDAVSIMDGRDEGVYAWITANYLLDTVRGDSPADAQPYAVLDLGGASTQIVFEPKFASEVGLALGEHRYELDFGGKTRVLYQHSYLGYGLMRARAAVHRLVEFTNSVRVRPDPVDSGIGNPCLGRGMRRKVLVQDERDGWSANVSMVGADVGSFEACERVVQLVMAKDAVCALKPCSFDGVYQPSLLDTFPSGPVLLLSYFYDRLAPLLPTQTLSSPFPISTIASLARAVCAGPESWDKPGGDGGLLKDLSRDVREELRGRPEYCLDLTFMYELLRLGYEFGEDRLVRVGKQVEGTELGWALGAAIALVGGELRCKA